MYRIKPYRLFFTVLIVSSVISIAVTHSSESDREREKYNVDQENWQQRVTMVRLRQVGLALFQYSEQYGQLPQPPVPNHPLPVYKAWSDLSGNFIRYPRPSYPWPVDPRREVSKLKLLLIPWFTKELPTVDYWQHPFFWDVSADRKHFIVISLGSDGEADTDLVSYFSAKDSWHDIAFYDLFFLSFAEGYTR